MRFCSIFVEDELTITKGYVEDLKEGRIMDIDSSNKAFYRKPFNGPVRFFSTLGNWRVKDFLTMKLNFVFRHIEEDCDANVTFSVPSANYSVKCQKRKIVDSGHQEWSANLCSIADALNTKKTFLVDGNLTIRVQAMIFYNPFGVQLKPCSNLPKILWDSDDKDFVIAVGAKDGPKTEVKIHKLIFGHRSPVFGRMLETEMTEKAKNCLEIIDFNVEVVQAVVEHFYDRDTFKSLNVENLLGLLLFADKYDIADLKAELERLFVFHLYPETVVKIGNASVITNSQTLKELCIKSLNLFNQQNVQFDDAENLDENLKNELGKEDVDDSLIQNGYYSGKSDDEESYGPEEYYEVNYSHE